MFNKLLSRLTDKKSVHPLGSDANLNAVLADIPTQSATRLLTDVGHWLAEMEQHIAEIGPQQGLKALTRLDQFSRPAVVEMLTRYLRPGSRETMSDSIWSMLDGHSKHLWHGYLLLLRQIAVLPAEQSEAITPLAGSSAARALRAWALGKKLQRFRYRSPPAAQWQEAHGLLNLLARMKLLQTRVVAYPQEDETSPLHEYLYGLYLELAPIGNLVPPQLEFVDSFLRSIDSLELASEAHPGSSYCIDLSLATGPQRIGNQTGPALRYCSTTRLRAAVMKLAAQIKRQEGVPGWLLELPASSEQISNALMTLALHWAPKPPQRTGDRQRQEGELKVMLGFHLARRMIAFSAFARAGHSLRYQGDDIARLFDARFGRVDVETMLDETLASAADTPATVNPLDTLRSLELAGDRAQMETWQQVDGSATGIGAIAPAILSKHRIGILVCLRYSDGVDWRLAIMRRIGRDAAQRPSIGLETLAWPSICALVQPVDAAIAWGNDDNAHSGWHDAILTSRDGTQLILAANSFIAGLEIRIRSSEGTGRLRLDTLIDRGPDYDRIDFSRLD